MVHYNSRIVKIYSIFLIVFKLAVDVCFRVYMSNLSQNCGAQSQAGDTGKKERPSELDEKSPECDKEKDTSETSSSFYEEDEQEDSGNSRSPSESSCLSSLNFVEENATHDSDNASSSNSSCDSSSTDDEYSTTNEESEENEQLLKGSSNSLYVSEPDDVDSLKSEIHEKSPPWQSLREIRIYEDDSHSIKSSTSNVLYECSCFIDFFMITTYSFKKCMKKLCRATVYETYPQDLLKNLIRCFESGIESRTRMYLRFEIINNVLLVVKADCNSYGSESYLNVTKYMNQLPETKNVLDFFLEHYNSVTFQIKDSQCEVLSNIDTSDKLLVDGDYNTNTYSNHFDEKYTSYNSPANEGSPNGIEDLSCVDTCKRLDNVSPQKTEKEHMPDDGVNTSSIADIDTSIDSKSDCTTDKTGETSNENELVMESEPKYVSIPEASKKICYDRKSVYECGTKFRKNDHVCISENCILAATTDIEKFDIRSLLHREVYLKYPNCTLQKINVKIKKEGSRNKEAPKIKANSSCRGSKCTMKFEYRVFEWFPEGSIGFLYVGGNLAENHTPQKQIRGERRAAIGEDMLLKGQSATGRLTEVLATTEEDRILKIPKSVVPSKHFFNKVKSEAMQRRKWVKGRKGSMCLLMETLGEIEKENNLPGFVQKLDVADNSVIFHSQKQMMAAQHCKTLHLDATGNVTNDMGKKELLFNAVSYEKSVPTEQRIVPLSQMLNTNSRAVDIKTHLLKLNADYKIANKKEFKPHTIVCDQNWAYMHSVAEVYCTKSLTQYLDDAFRGKQDVNMQLCNSHMFKNIATKAKKVAKGDDTGELMKELCMRVYNTLSSVESQQELDHKFEMACNIFLSKDESYSDKLNEMFPHTKEYADRLEELAKSKKKYEMLDTKKVIKKNARTYRDKTIPGKHYCAMAEKVKNLNSTSSPKKNRYYCPSFINYLVTHVMPLSPLWSSINHDRVSNAPIENFHRILKHEYLENQKVDGATLVEKCYKYSSSQASLYLQQKSVSSMNDQNEKLKKSDKDVSKETWQRRVHKKGYKSMTHTAARYFKNATKLRKWNGANNDAEAKNKSRNIINTINGDTSYESLPCVEPTAILPVVPADYLAVDTEKRFKNEFPHTEGVSKSFLNENNINLLNKDIEMLNSNPKKTVNLDRNNKFEFKSLDIDCPSTPKRKRYIEDLSPTKKPSLKNLKIQSDSSVESCLKNCAGSSVENKGMTPSRLLNKITFDLGIFDFSDDELDSLPDLTVQISDATVKNSNVESTPEHPKKVIEASNVVPEIAECGLYKRLKSSMSSDGCVNSSNTLEENSNQTTTDLQQSSSNPDKLSNYKKRKIADSLGILTVPHSSVKKHNNAYKFHEYLFEEKREQHVKELKTRKAQLSNSSIELITRKINKNAKENEPIVLACNDFVFRGEDNIWRNNKYIQVQHVNGNHWVTVSNVMNNEEAVTIYDSLSHSENYVNGLLQDKSVQSVLGALKASTGINEVHVPIGKTQTDDYSCGLWALHNTLTLFKGTDPTTICFDYKEQEFRQKLLEFYEDENVSPSRIYQDFNLSEKKSGSRTCKRRLVFFEN